MIVQIPPLVSTGQFAALTFFIFIELLNLINKDILIDSSHSLYASFVECTINFS